VPVDEKKRVLNVLRVNLKVGISMHVFAVVDTWKQLTSEKLNGSKGVSYYTACQ
jgi:hypothetical protein